MGKLGFRELEQEIMSWANSCERVYRVYIEYAIQDGESCHAYCRRLPSQ